MRRLYWLLFEGEKAYFTDTRDTVYGLADDMADVFLNGTFIGSANSLNVPDFVNCRIFTS